MQVRQLYCFSLNQASRCMMISFVVLVHCLDTAHELPAQQAVLGHELAACTFQQQVVPIPLMNQGEKSGSKFATHHRIYFLLSQWLDCSGA